MYFTLQSNSSGFIYLIYLVLLPLRLFTFLPLLPPFSHLQHLHLWLRSLLNCLVYESSLSALMQQNRIENKTVKAPAILSISAINAGIVSLYFGFDLIVMGLSLWFVSILRIIDINGFNFSRWVGLCVMYMYIEIKKC